MTHLFRHHGLLQERCRCRFLRDFRQVEERPIDSDRGVALMVPTYGTPSETARPQERIGLLFWLQHDSLDLGAAPWFQTGECGNAVLV